MRRRIYLLLFLLALLQFSAFTAEAFQLQVSVSVNKRRVTVQETVTLIVSLQGSGIEKVSLPELFPSSFNVISKSDRPNLVQDAFGKPVGGRLIKYQLQPTFGGKFRLGAFSITYAGETYRVAGEVVEVQGPNPPPSKKREAENFDVVQNIPVYGSTVVKLAAEVDRSRAYVNEKITLSIRITHNSLEVSEIKLTEAPRLANFWNRELDLAKHVNPSREIFVGGRPFVTQLIPRFILYPTTSGKLTIPALSYSMNVLTAKGSKTMQAMTSPITIDVMPLPEKGQPPEFKGAVGSCNFRAELKEKVTKLGAPTHLVLEVETDGNIDSITPPPLPQIEGAKVYNLNRVSVKQEKELPVACWEADLVPTTAGKLTIPAISFAYFDPKQKGYQVIKSEPMMLEVIAPINKAKNEPNRRSFFSFLFAIFQLKVVRYGLLIILVGSGLAVGFILAKRQPEKSPPSPNTSKTPKKVSGQLNETLSENRPKSVAEELRRIVNSSFGKLHRGDERAYAGELLRTMRKIFETLFSVQSSELTAERIEELLLAKGVEIETCQKTKDLFQECEKICYTPVGLLPDAEEDRDKKYARFTQARETIFKLIEMIDGKI